MVEMAAESVPLRATDWRKSRLSKGVYCVEIEGIPCSNARVTSLDQKPRESKESVLHLQRCSTKHMQCDASLMRWVKAL